jgi:hypothetical protein
MKVVLPSLTNSFESTISGADFGSQATDVKNDTKKQARLKRARARKEYYKRHPQKAAQMRACKKFNKDQVERKKAIDEIEKTLGLVVTGEFSGVTDAEHFGARKKKKRLKIFRRLMTGGLAGVNCLGYGDFGAPKKKSLIKKVGKGIAKGAKAVGKGTVKTAKVVGKGAKVAAKSKVVRGVAKGAIVASTGGTGAAVIAAGSAASKGVKAVKKGAKVVKKAKAVKKAVAPKKKTKAVSVKGKFKTPPKTSMAKSLVFDQPSDEASQPETKSAWKETAKEGASKLFDYFTQDKSQATVTMAPVSPSVQETAQAQAVEEPKQEASESSPKFAMAGSPLMMGVIALAVGGVLFSMMRK